jgi:Methyltransferase domain
MLSSERRWSTISDGTPIIEYVPPARDTSTMSLTELADHYKTDKGNIKHGYTAFYERYLAHLKDQPIALLEIGVGSGCSLKMWSDYFRNASIHGIDIRPECADLCQAFPRIAIAVMDAKAASLPGPFDIIIDDGSHVSQDIVDAFSLNWPNLKPGGYYAIEDFRPTYDESLWGDIDRRRCSRHHIAEFIDALMQNADLREGRQVESLHYHRELLIIQKSASPQRPRPELRTA